MEIRSKLWIEANGEPIFGKGRSRLLQAIDRHGSINRAAKEVDISYRKAWSYIDAMENRLGVKLVERKTGGRNGGGAILTDAARMLIHNYEQMEQEVTAMSDVKFAGIFGSQDIPNTETLQRKVPVTESVGMVLAHDITEIRSKNFKGVAFKKGHIISSEDIKPLLSLGKDNLFVLDISEDEMHEDDAALALAEAVAGDGIKLSGRPAEGKIKLIAARDGLLKVNRHALLEFNMVGDVMCATLHDNSPVKKDQEVGGIRAIPLVVKRSIINTAVDGAQRWGKILTVRAMKKCKAGIVVTGNEVYYGRIKDAFRPVIESKIKTYGGEIIAIHYAPDDVAEISTRLRELVNAGSDLLIVTGGMSVDPDDVTRHAIGALGASNITYGSAVLPGAMFLVAYLEKNGGEGNFPKRIPIVGVPACGIYYRITVLDLILPRILAGEQIGRRELAELGHGGLCLNCGECIYPRCPFGK